MYTEFIICENLKMTGTVPIKVRAVLYEICRKFPKNI